MQEGHPLNSYGVVPGPEQTAGRAELYAAVKVLERTTGDVYMIIDNKACVHNMMALIDGRLVPHGKRADLHRRAINAYEHKEPRSLRVKWVPSHMKEEDPEKGKITWEDRHGNAEADKRATMGVELHKVPLHKEKEGAKQDELVEGLLQMLLSIMDNIHDKAPVRKPEEKQEREYK